MSADARSCIAGEDQALEQAIATCSNALATPGQSGDLRAQLFNARGELYCHTAQYDLAIADQSEALRLKPDFPEAHVDRAGCYMGKNDYRAALADYDAAIQLAPNRPGYYSTRAQIRIWVGDHDGALADYDRAVRLAPNFPQYLFERGLILFGMGRYHDAAEQFVASSRAFPTSPRQVIWLHIARARAHEQDDAEFLAGANRLAPGDGPAPFVEMFLGRSTPGEASAQAEGGPGGPADGACDTGLFTGEYYLIRNQTDLARNSFAQGSSACRSTQYFNDLRLLVDWAEYNRLEPSARGRGPLW